MEISLKRDGLTLRGDLLKPEDAEKCPVAVIFHGLMSSRGKTDESMFYRIAYALLERGIASVRFDFNGHGDSDGEFRDMNVFNEILDAGKIIDYVRSLPFASDIYIAGHSQG
ncbi:MAG: alpha/beta hydrolase family protein, partial [Candidatus Ornithomonoglobus sp.]